MHVSLTPELEEIVRKNVETGRYNSSSELVREALRLWIDHQEIQREKLKALRTKLAVGEAQADRGEFVDYNLASLLTELDKDTQQP